MNITSLSTGALQTKSAAGPSATPSPQGTDAVSVLFKNRLPGSTDKPSETRSSSSKEGPVPFLEAAKKLKELSKQLIALTLIQDPVARAKAAANLYKQYAQVAKEYAGGTADGRNAAATATAATATAPGAATAGVPPTDPSATNATPQDGAGAGAGADADAVAAPADDVVTANLVTTDGALDMDKVAQAVTAALDGAAAYAATAANAMATPQAPAASGPKVRFVADVMMEQIKTFAKAAEQLYRAAVEEARHKKADKTKLHGVEEGMINAKEDLTESAKAVEGPDATAEPVTSTAVVDVTV